MFEKLFKKKEPKLLLSAFTSGELKPIEEVPDPVFSEKMMGDGIAIVPDVNDGIIYAPCSGEIVVKMPTNHAVGIRMENGIEVLLHLGLETCNLDGSGINVLVNVGDKVLKKQKIAEIKSNLLHDENVNMISMMIITKADEFKMINDVKGKVSFDDEVVELVRR